MDNSKELKDCERIAKRIAKTNNLICKTISLLKNRQKIEDLALEKLFKPIVEPLKQTIENIANDESQSIK